MTRTEYIFSLREIVADNIQYHRRQLGMNQTIFSEHLGLSEHAVYLLENPHKGGPTLSTLATIAHVLGVSVVDLLTQHEGRTRLRGRAAQQPPRKPKRESLGYEVFRIGPPCLDLVQRRVNPGRGDHR